MKKLPVMIFKMKVNEIKLNEIKQTYNVRQKEVHREDAENLMQSIRNNGLLQPIGVKQETDNSYIIIWGNRRLEACKKLGWKEIPAVIFSDKDDDMTEEDFVIINAVENQHQKPNSLLELGRAVAILRDRGLNHEEIAIRLSIPKSRILTALNEAQRLPEEWIPKVKVTTNPHNKGGNIPYSTASAVAGLRGLDKEEKGKLLEHIKKENLGATDARLIASLVRSGKTLTEAKKAQKDFKSVSMKFYVNKEKYEKIIKCWNFTEFVIDCLNQQEKGLAFRTADGRHELEMSK